MREPYGGVRGLDNIADDVVIIAHETFMSNLSNNSMGGLGPAIGFRVDYSLGTEDYNGTPAVTVNVSKNLFVGILLGTIDFTEKLAEGLITIDGKTQLAPQFFASHDKPAENPRITLR